MKNALNPGVYSWSENAYLTDHDFPSQAQAPAAMPDYMRNMNKPQQKKRGPVMNALSGIAEFLAPEAVQAGRDVRTQRQLGNMLAQGDTAGAGGVELPRELGDLPRTNRESITVCVYVRTLKTG
jgi:hypothetical protein